MVLIISFLTLLFLSIAFLATVPSDISSNPFVGYLMQQFFFIIHYYLFFFFGFIVLTMVFIYFNFRKKYSPVKTYLLSTLQTLVLSLFSLLLAYILLFVIAFLQLTIFSVVININSRGVGIITDRQAIVTALLNNNHPPDIIATDRTQEKILKAIASATTGTDTFYGGMVLPQIPSQLVVPIKDIHSGMMLIDNTLIITQISQGDMQAISPVVGYLFVKSYFSVRDIKAYPRISMMDRNEYLVYRKKDANEKIKKIDMQIEKIDKYISSISASIKSDGAKRSPQNKQKIAAQNILEEYQYYVDFFRTQRKAVLSMKDNLPHEMGVFSPKDSIKIVLDTKNPHAIADYFATVTHEYLHSASYVSDQDRFSNSFFEEGLTEYFARSAIKESLHTSTNLGYPVQVKIIAEITKMIPESELAEIYFTKDEEGLVRALDRVYGDGFVADNYTLFETLQYTSSPHQVLKLANMLMRRIGGAPLTEKDLVSTSSNL